ncbi:MAG: hypothetical protein WCA09_16955, partial [Burkholderiales bacterium]
MKRRFIAFAVALAISGGAQAQSNEELKGMLDQALKTIQDLQTRVKALEQEKRAAPAAQPSAPAPGAPAPAAAGAPVVAPESTAEKG